MTSAHKNYGPGLDGEPMKPLDFGNTYERLDPARNDPDWCRNYADLSDPGLAPMIERFRRDEARKHLRRRPFAELMSRLAGWLRWR